ncbi:hypothetical protein JRQ81_005580 [Phrynocephalus forsythii]|uniref:Uncharacterized protein n=1 Tax=Phrynocephalus forsythii TaxID=171643 RepID=A0A9Q0XGG3_9SAUR|nr:hypothetical protein JRQ81_005580 [Phrynocephalus forsythii]
MQSTIRSFFQPLARKKVEEQREEKNHSEEETSPKKKPVNSEQLINNGAPCTENSTPKKASQVLNSGDEVNSGKSDIKNTKTGNNKQEFACVTEQRNPADNISPSTSPSASNSPSPTIIPRRKTARKQIPKRKAEEEDNT